MLEESVRFLIDKSSMLVLWRSSTYIIQDAFCCAEQKKNISLGGAVRKGNQDLTEEAQGGQTQAYVDPGSSLLSAQLCMDFNFIANLETVVTCNRPCDFFVHDNDRKR